MRKERFFRVLIEVKIRSDLRIKIQCIEISLSFSVCLCACVCVCICVYIDLQPRIKSFTMRYLYWRFDYLNRTDSMMHLFTQPLAHIKLKTLLYGYMTIEVNSHKALIDFSAYWETHWFLWKNPNCINFPALAWQIISTIDSIDKGKDREIESGWGGRWKGIALRLCWKLLKWFSKA